MAMGEFQSLCCKTNTAFVNKIVIQSNLVVVV